MKNSIKNITVSTSSYSNLLAQGYVTLSSGEVRLFNVRPSETLGYFTTADSFIGDSIEEVCKEAVEIEYEKVMGF